MWQVITKTVTEAPPQPTRLRSSRAAGDTYSDRGAWTYGGALEDADFDHYDSQLRFLVMWCLGKMSSSQDRSLRGPPPAGSDRRLITHKWTNLHSGLP